MDWDELLKMDVSGWDVEANEGFGGIYRGPLESIEQRDRMVYFNSKWMAVWLGNDDWMKWKNTQCYVNIEFSAPIKDADGRIRIPIPWIGFLILFPPSTENLDASKVKGLIN